MSLKKWEKLKHFILVEVKAEHKIYAQHQLNPEKFNLIFHSKHWSNCNQVFFHFFFFGNVDAYTQCNENNIFICKAKKTDRLRFAKCREWKQNRPEPERHIQRSYSNDFIWFVRNGFKCLAWGFNSVDWLGKKSTYGKRFNFQYVCILTVNWPRFVLNRIVFMCHC